MKTIYAETKCYEEANREPLPDGKVLIKAGSFDFIKNDQIVSVYSVDFDDDKKIIVNARNNQFNSPSTDVPERYIWSFTPDQYVVLKEVSHEMSTEVAKPRLVSRDAKSTNNNVDSDGFTYYANLFCESEN